MRGYRYRVQDHRDSHRVQVQVEVLIERLVDRTVRGLMRRMRSVRLLRRIQILGHDLSGTSP
jgi:hypothetical protein